MMSAQSVRKTAFVDEVMIPEMHRAKAGMFLCTYKALAMSQLEGRGFSGEVDIWGGIKP